jgi:hypothetical protein
MEGKYSIELFKEGTTFWRSSGLTREGQKTPDLVHQMRKLRQIAERGWQRPTGERRIHARQRPHSPFSILRIGDRRHGYWSCGERTLLSCK